MVDPPLLFTPQETAILDNKVQYFLTPYNEKMPKSPGVFTLDDAARRFGGITQWIGAWRSAGHARRMQYMVMNEMIDGDQLVISAEIRTESRRKGDAPMYFLYVVLNEISLGEFLPYVCPIIIPQIPMAEDDLMSMEYDLPSNTRFHTGIKQLMHEIRNHGYSKFQFNCRVWGPVLNQPATEEDYEGIVRKDHEPVLCLTLPVSWLQNFLQMQLDKHGHADVRILRMYSVIGEPTTARSNISIRAVVRVQRNNGVRRPRRVATMTATMKKNKKMQDWLVTPDQRRGPFRECREEVNWIMVPDLSKVHSI